MWCHICGEKASFTCKKCDGAVCKTHYNKVSGWCSECEQEHTQQVAIARQQQAERNRQLELELQQAKQQQQYQTQMQQQAGNCPDCGKSLWDGSKKLTMRRCRGDLLCFNKVCERDELCQYHRDKHKKKMEELRRKEEEDKNKGTEPYIDIWANDPKTW